MKLPLITGFVFLLSCAHQPPRPPKIFVVSNDSSLKRKNGDGHVVNAPYYLPWNLIVDKNQHIFFFCQKPHYYCITGDRLDNAAPDFINLRPEEVLEIPSENILKFVKLNLEYSDNSEKEISIASTTDTISMPVIIELFAFLSTPANKIHFAYRKTTQEENIVLGLKRRHQVYISNDIIWDSSKTLFPPTVLPTLKFIPPPERKN